MLPVIEEIFQEVHINQHLLLNERLEAVDAIAQLNKRVWRLRRDLELRLLVRECLVHFIDFDVEVMIDVVINLIY